MALFSRKPMKPCPVCGRELRASACVPLKDALVCRDCADRARGALAAKKPEKGALGDPLRAATLSEVRKALSRRNHADRLADKALEADGAACEAVFVAEEAWRIEPRAQDVGVRRAKLLKGATVVRGSVREGSFRVGDEVRILGGGSAAVLECFRQSASDFETELRANLPHRALKAGDAAWLILDAPASAGSVVVR